MTDRQMFSILCPSRGRPLNVERLYQSLEATTEGEWELLVRLDDDDPTTAATASLLAVERPGSLRFG
jgi:hypothetical protein